jgi:hypothetical protein
MDDSTVRQEFGSAVEAEIVRRMTEGVNHMRKEEIADVGERAGIARDEAVREFERLENDVWRGQRSKFGNPDESQDWSEVFFDREWFQEVGKLP